MRSNAALGASGCTVGSRQIDARILLLLACSCVLAACGQSASPTPEKQAAPTVAPKDDAQVARLYPVTGDIKTIRAVSDCNIELLNGKPLAGGALKVDTKANYAISGWVVNSTQKDAADPLDMVITPTAVGSTGWMTKSLPRTERPDVVHFFNDQSSYLKSGFAVLLPSHELKPGTYRLALEYGSDSERRTCGSGTMFEVTP